MTLKTLVSDTTIAGLCLKYIYTAAICYLNKMSNLIALPSLIIAQDSGERLSSSISTWQPPSRSGSLPWTTAFNDSLKTEIR